MEADAMISPLVLSNDEYLFLFQMLEREEEKLLVEARHTDNRHFREEVNRRIDLVRQLAGRVKNLKVASAGSHSS
jgi:hypothetical protein